MLQGTQQEPECHPVPVVNLGDPGGGSDPGRARGPGGGEESRPVVWGAQVIIRPFLRKGPGHQSRWPTVLGVAAAALVVIVILCVLWCKKKAPLAAENPGKKPGQWLGGRLCLPHRVPLSPSAQTGVGVTSLCKRSWTLGTCEGNESHLLAWWVVEAGTGDDVYRVIGRRSAGAGQVG